MTVANGIARRARCVLLLADGRSYAVICTALAVTDRFIARWKQRYLAGGVVAMADALRAGRQDHRLTPAQEARLVYLTAHTAPPAPLTHWTAARLARRVVQVHPVIADSNTVKSHVRRIAGQVRATTCQAVRRVRRWAGAQKSASREGAA